MKRFWLALLFAGALHVQSASGCMNPGDNVAAIVAAAPSGTAFCFSAGTYRLTSTIVPKDNDSFTGAAGRTSVISGAIVASGFSLVGGVYVANIPYTYSNSQCFAQGGCACLPGVPACGPQEDLFVDNVPYQRQTSSAVTAGQWYWDYAQGKVYIPINPAGHTVEISVVGFGFSGAAAGVNITGLTIEKFAGQAVLGRIDGGTKSSAWVIQNNNIRFGHVAAVALGNTMQVLDNTLCDNGKLGIIGGGSGVLIQNNEICRNNYAGYSANRGGVKSDGSTNLVYRGNFVHDNVGAGLHTDSFSTGTLYENNHLVNNQNAGIDEEISHGAIIRNNLLENEARNLTSGNTFGSGGAIWIFNSDNVEIYGNTVTGSSNSIGAHETLRTTDGVDVKNLYVHDNFITQPATNQAAGIQSGSDSSINPAVFTTWNNRFVNNHYCLTNLAGNFYQWSDTLMTKATWQAIPQDATGVWHCPVVLPGPPPVMLSVIIQ